MAIWPSTSCKLCQLRPVHCTAHTWPNYAAMFAAPASVYKWYVTSTKVRTTLTTYQVPHLVSWHVAHLEIYFRFWGRRLYNCKKSSSITSTVTESFKQEIEFSLHHMVMSQLASFNLYQFLVVFQTGWNWSTTRYGSPSYCSPAGETL